MSPRNNLEAFDAAAKPPISQTSISDDGYIINQFLTSEPYVHSGPKHSSNWFSCLNMFPGFMLTLRAYLRSVAESDLYSLFPPCTIEGTNRAFSRHWKLQMLCPDPSLAHAIFMTFHVRCVLILFLLIVHSAAGYALPMLIPDLVRWLINPARDNTKYLIYIAIIFGSQLVASYAYQHVQLICWQVGICIRSILTTEIYNKAIAIRMTRYCGPGLIVNLISTDAQLIMDTFWLFMSGLVTPLQIICTIALLQLQLGPYALIPLGVLLIGFPLTALISLKFSRQRSHIQNSTDTRVKFIKEFLSYIQTIKYCVFEVPFLKNITRARKTELGQFRRLFFTRTLLYFVTFNMPTIAIALTFFFFGFNQQLSLDSTFTAIALLNMLRIPFVFLPLSLMFLGQYHICLQRIKTFLLISPLESRHSTLELPPGSAVAHGASFVWNNPRDVKDQLRFVESAAVAGQHEEAAPPPSVWTEDPGMATSSAGDVAATREEMQEIEPPSPTAAAVWTLSGVDLDIKPGTLVMVVGPVGCGKSALVHGLLGEMHKTAGIAELSGSVAYVPQEPSIFSTSIRENILFGQPFDAELYEMVINATALGIDIREMPASDLTELGDSGHNLSGGQRQRISIARAMYRRADVVILDDPLSALDACVAEHVFENVIKVMVAEKRTVILVLNQLHLASHADHLIVMDARGAITAQGPPQALAVGTSDDTLLASISLEKIASDAISEVSTSAERLIETQDFTQAFQSKLFYLQPDEELANFNLSTYFAKEASAVGQVTFKTVHYYFVATGRLLLLILLGFSLLMTASRVYGSYWLADWANPQMIAEHTNTEYLSVYIGLVGSEAVFMALVSFVSVFMSVRASYRTHRDVFKSILYAPMTWFQKTPLGVILTIFSKDMSLIDMLLFQQIEQLINMACQLMSSIVLILIGSWLSVLVFVAVGFVFYLLLSFCRLAIVQIYRLETLSRAPIFSHISQSIHGASTIRAHGLEAEFCQRNLRHLEINTICLVSVRIVAQLFGLLLGILSALVQFFVFLAIYYNVTTSNISDIDFGAVLNSITATGLISHTVATLSYMAIDTESKFVAVERCMDYMNLEREDVVAARDSAGAAPEVQTAVLISESWPWAGAISIENVWLEYKPGVPILKGISLNIPAGQKIGVVGRTGAGKSSLVTLLMRVMPLIGGRIFIDDIDIREVPLQMLRMRIGIIPQVPTMFAGTLRFNLDPLACRSDDQIWKAIRAAEMYPHFRSDPLGLETRIDEGGSNLSLGQRQLLSMARVLLQNPRILLLDEPTASVDTETEENVQTMLRTLFSDITVISIVHRLTTVVQNDRIVVMSKGQIVEDGTPRELLSNEHSVFSDMVRSTDPDTVATIRKMVNLPES